MSRGPTPFTRGKPTRTTRRASFAILVSVFASLEGARVHSQTAPPTPDLKSIAGAYREQEQALRSLFVEYRHVGRVLATAEEALRHLGPIAMKIEETRAFAFKGAKRYSRFDRTGSLADDVTRLEFAHKESRVASRSIHVKANSIAAFDGQTIRIRNAGGTSASIIDAGAVESEDDYFDCEYLAAILRVPPDAFNRGDGRTARRLASLIDSGACAARPLPESVDGAPCVVIEARLKSPLTLWCDPAVGHAVRRVEGSFDFGAGPRPMRTTCADFVHVCAGLWLPRRCETAIFADAAARDSNRAPLVTWSSNVLEVHANDVSDELFSLSIPEGTYVLDYAKGTKDLLGRRYAMGYHMTASDSGRANGPLATQGSPAGGPGRGHGLEIALACGSAALAVLGGLILRLRRRQGEPTDPRETPTDVRRPVRLPYHDA